MVQYKEIGNAWQGQLSTQNEKQKSIRPQALSNKKNKKENNEQEQKRVVINLKDYQSLR